MSLLLWWFLAWSYGHEGLIATTSVVGPFASFEVCDRVRRDVNFARAHYTVDCWDDGKT